MASVFNVAASRALTTFFRECSFILLDVVKALLMPVKVSADFPWSSEITLKLVAISSNPAFCLSTASITCLELSRTAFSTASRRFLCFFDSKKTTTASTAVTSGFAISSKLVSGFMVTVFFES